MLSQKRIFSSMNPIGIDRGRKKKTKLGSAEEAERKKKQKKKWYFVTKIVLTYCEKKLFYWSRKLLKFEAEGQEFAKFLRSLEQFIQAVKVQNNFW